MLHILLADDNPGDVLLIREALRGSSLEADVIVAHNGEQALRFLSHSKPDVIFLDLNIPKVSGLEFLERSKATETTPVIVLTSSENPVEKKRALELGVRQFITKPIELAEFFQVIRTAMENIV